MRAYYNHRMGSSDRAKFDLHEVTQQVEEAFRELDDRGYFQRAFGYRCVDSGRTTGLHGTLEMYFYRRTGIRMRESCAEFIQEADEIGLFTVIEFLYDHAAKPDQKAGWFHDYSGCGWHFNPDSDSFNVTEGHEQSLRRFGEH